MIYVHRLPDTCRFRWSLNKFQLFHFHYIIVLSSPALKFCLFPFFRGQNRLELTQDIVCGQMLNSSLASVIFSASLTSSAKFLDLVISSAYTLSFYKLPVVGVMVRDAEFSKKVQRGKMDFKTTFSSRTSTPHSSVQQLHSPMRLTSSCTCY